MGQNLLPYDWGNNHPVTRYDLGYLPDLGTRLLTHQIIHFNRMFHLKQLFWSILGIRHLRKPPNLQWYSQTNMGCEQIIDQYGIDHSKYFQIFPNHYISIWMNIPNIIHNLIISCPWIDIGHGPSMSRPSPTAPPSAPALRIGPWRCSCCARRKTSVMARWRCTTRCLGILGLIWRHLQFLFKCFLG